MQLTEHEKGRIIRTAFYKILYSRPLSNVSPFNCLKTGRYDHLPPTSVEVKETWIYTKVSAVFRLRNVTIVGLYYLLFT
jgi:hypothetical protein